MGMILPRAYLEDPADFDGRRLDRRDPHYIRDLLPYTAFAWRHWFRCQVTGLDHLPASGPFLMVGNHNGGINAPDTAMTLHAWSMRFGVDRAMHALIHPSMFTVPYLNVHLMKLGGVAATARNAMRVLDLGLPLLMYPGGGNDAYRPWEHRHRIRLEGRDAFVRLALHLRLPVLPIVSLGAHETLIVLDDGRERARALGWDKAGVVRVPLTLSFPYGLTLGTPMNLPFPVRIRLRVGAPIQFATSAPRPDRDAATVRRCYVAVERVMQRMLDELCTEREKATS
jgi:1-acyl-sn-glycerol-3-phosphate acyltransferase